jgi:hypothetical protein
MIDPSRVRAALAPLATIAVLSFSFLTGCAGHEARTFGARTALDEGRPEAAIASLDHEMGVAQPNELPAKVEGDDALLVLDRASIQQSVKRWQLSTNDFQAADKAIDMLDLAHNAGDTIGEYVFSGSSGKYRAPPYEKLMINTLNMINYLELGDLNGARIEARRLAVLQRYFTDNLHEGDNAILGLGGLLAGFTFEKSGDAGEALHWYDEAVGFSPYPWLRGPLRTLMTQSSYTTPRLRDLVNGPASGQAGGAPMENDVIGGDRPAPPGAPPAPPGAARGDTGDVLVVVGYGRVPGKIPNRVPIGLALTLVAGDIEPGKAAAANRLAAQGLVTWVNYPSLGPEHGGYALPEVAVDGSFVQLTEAVDVTTQVREEWKKIEGKIILSAITRLIARVAVGQGIEKAGGNGVVGVLASLGAQATLTALDTPDTRSWETLPARVAVARFRLPVGDHPIELRVRGVVRREILHVQKGGWTTISLMALR